MRITLAQAYVTKLALRRGLRGSSIVPGCGTMLLLASGAAGLAGYTTLRWRAKSGPVKDRPFPQ